MKQYSGSCHCGNVTFEFSTPAHAGRLPVRVCGCSFCVKHGGAYTSNPAGVLRANVSDPSLLIDYRFGTGTATFHVCKRCGAVPFVTSEIDGNSYAVVNVNTFDGLDPAETERAPRDFDGETVEARLQRRRESWIPDVHVMIQPLHNQ